jgi:hypothetical protein
MKTVRSSFNCAGDSRPVDRRAQRLSTCGQKSGAFRAASRHRNPRSALRPGSARIGLGGHPAAFDPISTLMVVVEMSSYGSKWTRRLRALCPQKAYDCFMVGAADPICRLWPVAKKSLRQQCSRRSSGARAKPRSGHRAASELHTVGQMQCELVHARARVRVRPCECPDLVVKTGETLWRHREKAILAPRAARN